MQIGLQKHHSYDKVYERKPEPVPSRSDSSEILRTDMRYDEDDDGRPDEMTGAHIYPHKCVIQSDCVDVRDIRIHGREG